MRAMISGAVLTLLLFWSVVGLDMLAVFSGIVGLLCLVAAIGAGIGWCVERLIQMARPRG